MAHDTDKRGMIEALQALRKRADFSSMEAFAKACGYRGASSVQRYFTPDGLENGYLPMKFVHKIKDALVGRGYPPITEDEVMQLAGVAVPSTKKRITVSGSVQAGAFNSDNELHPSECFEVELPADLHGVPGISALLVKGDSMDIALPEGSVVFVQNLFQFENDATPLQIGDFIVVQRSNSHDEWETTVKEIAEMKDDGTLILIPRSRNPRHIPLVFGPEDHIEESFDDGRADRKRILGVVLRWTAARKR